MFKQLKSMFSGGGAQPAATDSGAETLAPDQPLFIVGDIHGCLSLMEAALDKIDAHLDATGLGTPKLIMLGDYVDRGEQSAQVLERLYQTQQMMPDDVICLMGNHERMMLEFLDDPAGRGTRWLNNGGLQTLASYSIGGLRTGADAEALTDASHALEAALPEGLLPWLRDLPLMFQSGNVYCVHAAMDPHLDPDDQSRRVLLWGHPEFMTTAREDGIWVAHGHTVVKEAHCQASRIALDTGAYHTGKLSVGVITTGDCTFI